MSGYPKYFKRATILVPAIWLIALYIIPLVIVLSFSFFQVGDYGGVNYRLTLSNYLTLSESNYIKPIFRTLVMASLNTLLCLLFGYPIAYYISSKKEKNVKSLLLFLILLPFWTNFLIRTYAWYELLGNNGILNTLLIKLHFIKEPLTILFTPLAVQIGLFYNYLPFMVMPLFSSIEKIPEQYKLAANDMGANRTKTFLFITLPLSLKGVSIGFALVFIPSLGEYIIPDLLGGGKAALMGNIITDQYLAARNWPLGSAMVFSLIGVVICGFVIRNVLFKKK